MIEEGPKHNLRDLRASPYRIVKICGTNALREGHWLLCVLDITDGGEALYSLFVRKEALEAAADLFPDAVIVAPDNTQLVTAQ